MNYKKAYIILFNSVSDAIAEIEDMKIESDEITNCINKLKSSAKYGKNVY